MWDRHSWLATLAVRLSRMALCLTLLAASLDARAQSDTKTFEGDGFTVEYPDDYTPRPSLRGAPPDAKPRSAFFDCPTSGVVFYAMAAATETSAEDILPDPATEKVLLDETTTATDGRTVRDFDIEARSGAYYRAIKIFDDPETRQRTVFAIKYPDEVTYAQVRIRYQDFKASLTRKPAP